MVKKYYRKPAAGSVRGACRRVHFTAGFTTEKKGAPWLRMSLTLL